MKRTVQAGIEEQWNARTPLKFVGWEACGSAEVDVRVRPISSQYQATGCGTAAKGQACAEWLGKDMATNRGVVNINVLFGEEVRYSSRYQQGAGSTYRSNLDLAYWWLPMACIDDFKRPWTTTNAQSKVVADINQPAVAADFDARYARCLQNLAVHEFGHVAGFAHEQYRTDDSAKQKACYDAERARGLSDDQPQNIATRYRGTNALGAFDSESIMSYCRTDPSPRLTAEDVANVYTAYGVTPPTNSGSGGSASAGNGGASGSLSMGGVAGRAGAAGASGTAAGGLAAGGVGVAGAGGAQLGGEAGRGGGVSAGGSEAGQSGGVSGGGQSTSGAAGAGGAFATGGVGVAGQSQTGGVTMGGATTLGEGSSGQGGASASANASGTSMAAGRAAEGPGTAPRVESGSGCSILRGAPTRNSGLPLMIGASLCVAAARRRKHLLTRA